MIEIASFISEREKYFSTALQSLGDKYDMGYQVVLPVASSLVHVEPDFVPTHGKFDVHLPDDPTAIFTGSGFCGLASAAAECVLLDKFPDSIPRALVVQTHDLDWKNAQGEVVRGNMNRISHHYLHYTEGNDPHFLDMTYRQISISNPRMHLDEPLFEESSRYTWKSPRHHIPLRLFAPGRYHEVMENMLTSKRLKFTMADFDLLVEALHG